MVLPFLGGVLSLLILGYFVYRYRKFRNDKINRKVGDESDILIEYSSDRKIATLIFNRPKKKNAISKRMYKAVTAALKMLSNDNDVKVILLRSSGDYYSSGNDLSNFTSEIMHPLSMAKEARRICYEFVDSFLSCKKVIVAAVNGPAIGIAVTSLGLCDAVYASRNATFRTPFSELAQSPEGCSSYMFPKIMGEEIANEVLWKGKLLTADDAKRCKLVKEIYETTEDLNQHAMKYCEELVKLPDHAPEGIRFTEKDTKLLKCLQQINKEECDELERRWVSKDCFEALACFLEKRKMRLAAGVLR